MLVWLLALACKGGAEDDPQAECEAAGAECCADAGCAGEQICHFSYTCAELGGQRVCSEPEGDRRCHDLCTGDSAEPDCPEAAQSCQTVEHVQGGDVEQTVDACF